MDALLFTIDARRCAIPLTRVSEVVHAVLVHPLPGAPAIVEGVVNVRGDIVPVLSLRARLGFAARPVRATEYFILARAKSRRVILRSDTTPEIISITAPAPDEGTQVDRALAGVVPMADGMALIHDVDEFLASVDDGALAAALAAQASAP